MTKLVSLMLATLLTTGYKVPKRNTIHKDYIIAGQNTVQKIFYKTSSSFSETYRGDKAIDNDKNTSWVSLKTNKDHWYEIDFGVKRILSKIEITPGKKNNSYTLKKFNLQFMYKHKWFDFAKINLQDIDSGEEIWKLKKGKIIVNLKGIDASTFRIFIPKEATYNGYAAISEVECYIGGSKIKLFDERLKGLYYPIKNGFLPESDYSYPNSPRKYRGGKHVGLDIFHYYESEETFKPIAVTKNTEICSVDDGVVLRADWHYKPMTVKEWKMRSKYFKKNPRTFVMRSFGGIQVWIDHGNGVISTYNHLSKIDKKIKVGKKVKKAQRIGWAGNSGLLGEAEGKDYGIHLHFELWIDSYYLGYGMPLKTVKKYIKWIFFDLQ